jgi:hypothetical protein
MSFILLFVNICTDHYQLTTPCFLTKKCRNICMCFDKKNNESVESLEFQTITLLCMIEPLLFLLK